MSSGEAALATETESLHRTDTGERGKRGPTLLTIAIPQTMLVPNDPGEKKEAAAVQIADIHQLNTDIEQVTMKPAIIVIPESAKLLLREGA